MTNRAFATLPRLAAAAVVLTLAACASAPVPVVAPQATITNSTGKALGGVKYQRCVGGDWHELPNAALAAGRSVTFPLPDACVNLNAHYADGKLAGAQKGIKREFPFTWVLY